MTAAQRISNRVSPAASLLTGGLAGGFLLAFHLPVRAANEPAQPPDDTHGKFAPNAFIRIDARRQDHAGHAAGRDGAGRLYLDRDDSGRRARRRFCEGQRSSTRRRTTSSTAIRMFGIQATGNSNSVRAFWKPLRTAGASARAMLVQAAAQQWQVDPASCTTANSEVMHTASGRKLAYGALADAAGNAKPPPKDVALKDPKDFMLIGKPLKRLDTPDKVNGKAIYGIDAMLPGMKFATIAASPGVRRQGRQCRRQRGQESPRRAASRRAGRSGRRGRRSHVGGEEGPRCARHHLERRPQRARQFKGHLGRSARGQRKGRRRREIRRRYRQGPWRPATSSKPPTNCRFWPMRRWSR